MIHNLTDKQLQGLRWLIKQVRDGKAKESFKANPSASIRVLGGPSRPHLPSKFLVNRHPAPDCLDSGVFDALVASEILIFNPKRQTYTLTRKAYEVADFDFNNPEPSPINLYMRETCSLIRKYFNREELDEVCFELDVKPDWIFGDKTDWPLHLLLYLYNQNRLVDLPPVLEKLRPGIDWPAYPGNETADN